MHTVLAEGNLSGAIGPVPANGIALVLIVVMGFGLAGKGKKKLASGPAQMVGFIGELAFLRSTGWTREIGESIRGISLDLASNPDLGAIGITSVCLIFLALAAFARIVPVTGAFLGMCTAGAFASADGALFKAFVTVAYLPLKLVGG
ncbi:hypothetical protein ACWD4N_47120 [Streptomyces sp. NPDC002586]